MNFSWIFSYWPLLAAGAVQTILLLVISVGFGFILAIGLALAQVSGPRWLKWLTRAYCTCLRGTPLLIQLWLLYYGVGSLLPLVPGLRGSQIRLSSVQEDMPKDRPASSSPLGTARSAPRSTSAS